MKICLVLGLLFLLSACGMGASKTVSSAPSPSSASPNTTPSPISSSGNSATFLAGQFTIQPNQGVNSGNGQVLAWFYLDNELIVSDAAGQQVWTSGSANTGDGGKATFQSDGNLVITDVNGVLQWNSNTAGNPGATLTFSPTPPYVYIDSSSGSRIWDSSHGLANAAPVPTDPSNPTGVTVSSVVWFSVPSNQGGRKLTAYYGKGSDGYLWYSSDDVTWTNILPANYSLAPPSVQLSQTADPWIELKYGGFSLILYVIDSNNVRYDVTDGREAPCSTGLSGGDAFCNQ